MFNGTRKSSFYYKRSKILKVFWQIFKLKEINCKLVEEVQKSFAIILVNGRESKDGAQIATKLSSEIKCNVMGLRSVSAS